MRRRHGRSAAWLCGLALLVASVAPACSSARGATAVRTVAVTIHYSHFSPAQLSVAAGETVRFTIRNSDPIDHEFILGDQSVQDREEAATDPIHDGAMPGMVSAPAGTTVSTVVTFPSHPAQPSLIYACHLPGHYAYGMRGSLQVTS
jgi:uncharacterized cupredoxin-like copper-binding protein